MTELQRKTNDSNEEYLEYKGIVFSYSHAQEWQYGAYDAFDMNPAALSGPTQRVDHFHVGEFEAKIVSDRDNLASDFKFYAEDIDETQATIVMKYYLAHGGLQELKLGVVENI